MKGIKIRITKEMFDSIADFALQNDMTFDEAVTECMLIGKKIDEAGLSEDVTDSVNQITSWQTSVKETDGE